MKQFDKVLSENSALRVRTLPCHELSAFYPLELNETILISSGPEIQWVCYPTMEYKGLLLLLFLLFVLMNKEEALETLTNGAEGQQDS